MNKHVDVDHCSGACRLAHILIYTIINGVDKNGNMVNNKHEVHSNVKKQTLNSNPKDYQLFPVVDIVDESACKGKVPFVLSITSCDVCEIETKSSKTNCKVKRCLRKLHAHNRLQT
ncbi:CLUMA_CG011735, isoform A [Clunio marinus]|uniref:CLUMA_CG011735, isoform A n=1 Tax=Clunio marinus TaxID=568069 RepID=A0A1J1IDT1_9DIPT|nr:CLUMA_CG011735, isoform A [Clunio marinus]